MARRWWGATHRAARRSRWLLDAIDQAATDANPEQLPAVVLCFPRAGVGSRRLVVLDLDAILAD